jgi:hypothetical protein
MRLPALDGCKLIVLSEPDSGAREPEVPQVKMSPLAPISATLTERLAEIGPRMEDVEHLQFASEA